MSSNPKEINEYLEALTSGGIPLRRVVAEDALKSGDPIEFLRKVESEQPGDEVVERLNSSSKRKDFYAEHESELRHLVEALPIIEPYLDQLKEAAVWFGYEQTAWLLLQKIERVMNVPSNQS